MAAVRLTAPILSVLVGVGLAGCAANLQGQPTLVGVYDGRALYSIRGFTDWGELEQNDARFYADKFAHGFCAAEPTIVQFEAGETRNVPGTGIRMLRWSATYTCEKSR